MSQGEGNFSPFPFDFFFYASFTVWVPLTPDNKVTGQKHDLPQRNSRENYFLKMASYNHGILGT